MSDSNVAISVVMGVYNGGQLINKTVESILSQTFGDFEFIIVDDGSTDDSAERLDEYSRADDRVTVIRQKNSGLTSALITGSNRVRGTFLARQDVGDVSLPTRFDQQLQYLNEQPDVVAVGSGYRRIGPEGEYLGQQVRRLTPRQVTDAFLSDGTGIPHTVALIRSDAFRLAGGYRKPFRFAQDSDLWYRLCQQGLLAEIDDCLFDWGIDVGGISASNRSRQQQLAGLARRAYDLRVRGEDDASILDQANDASWSERMEDNLPPQTDSAAAAEFFIGSQLYALRDARCRRYFHSALRRRPFWPKAWVKLALSYISASRQDASENFKHRTPENA